VRPVQRLRGEAPADGRSGARGPQHQLVHLPPRTICHPGPAVAICGCDRILAERVPPSARQTWATASRSSEGTKFPPGRRTAYRACGCRVMGRDRLSGHSPGHRHVGDLVGFPWFLYAEQAADQRLVRCAGARLACHTITERHGRSGQKGDGAGMTTACGSRATSLPVTIDRGYGSEADISAPRRHAL